jgi:hypothetical protein
MSRGSVVAVGYGLTDSPVGQLAWIGEKDSAVGVDDRSGDVAGSWGGQELGDRGDLLGAPEPFEGHRVGGVPRPLQHRGVDRPGGIASARIPFVASALASQRTKACMPPLLAP